VVTRVVAARSFVGGFRPMLYRTTCVVGVSHNHVDVRRML
jgi:hypothetical protein